MESIGVKDKILEYVDGHGQLMFALVIALIVIIIAMYLNSCGWDLKVASGCSKKSRKSATFDEEDEIDSLIESIRSKQKQCK